MYVPLSPCPSCQRHVRTNTAACPFCDAALDRDPERAARLIRDHIEATTKIILRGLSTQNLQAEATT